MRINHANLSRTIIYGTSAVRISEPGVDATHRWRVYVRGYKNTDISYFIRSITFKTHETFANPTRTVEGPPFEIEECGWGEFTIAGKIYFTDAHEKPLSFIVSLKLHNDPTNRVIGDIEYNANEIVNERMDTIIFESPSEAIYKIMQSHEEPAFDGDIEKRIVEERTKIEKAIDYLISKLGEENIV
ncbi:YEATS domain-containing protein 4 [Nematocida minor]|uniref:YEATS domain-containing protein 4 n=1 Tax=Nematocida minor TaxID=1912983 RepID=UPI00221E5F1C|nr:YEATS domain-containing protein 4 [Nematocida minor]XP_051332063.1 YEATS domain-containing protein 4 [Nematocida minor]KAI5188793.1 YEATS domain-containing protein 4 [Nematocida minor]KAI5188897.1 YEATS domain-containing protein 4 [Nematocida minor]